MRSTLKRLLQIVSGYYRPHFFINNPGRYQALGTHENSSTFRRQVCLWYLCLLFLPQIWSQGSVLALDNPAYHILDRLEIKCGLFTPYQSNLKYFTREAGASFALHLDTTPANLSLKDRRDLYYLYKDNNDCLGDLEKTKSLAERLPAAPTRIQQSIANDRYIESKKKILNVFYPTPANMLELNSRDFYLRLNPIFNFNIGSGKAEEYPLFVNQRGLELRGGVDNRIYFYTNILETQARYPAYVRDYIKEKKAIPGAGFYKSYKSLFTDVQDGYDFLNSQAVLGFNFTRHVGAQFGYGRNFIGNGYRSLFLSDFSNNYLFLKLNWQLGRFHLQNIFTELSAFSAQSTPGDQLVPKKYMAAHYFGFDFSPKFSMGVFESVVFSRNKHFELQYLNPIILYRTAEQALGSADNALLGLSAKWNLFKRHQLYGQLLFDEFKFKELIIDGDGWWANKYGLQAGWKYIDAFGVDHLDLQLEYNVVRPYTYAHRDSISNYSHNNLPLAHPLGANFKEWLFITRFQPKKNLFLEARLITYQRGEDGTGENWGGDILKLFNTRQQDYGNKIGQGNTGRVFIAGFDMSYQIAHNLFADLQYFYRNKTLEKGAGDQLTQSFALGFRMNIGKMRMDF